MKRTLSRLAALLACVGLVVQPVFAQGPPTPLPPLGAPSQPPGGSGVPAQDVALGADGTLRGQVIDSQGMKYAGVSVSLQLDAKEVAGVVTDGTGSFAVGGVRPGVYRVASYMGDRVVRVWPAGAAPPQSAPQVVITPTIPGSGLRTTPLPRRQIFWWSLFGGGLAGAAALGFNAGLDRHPHSH